MFACKRKYRFWSFVMILSIVSSFLLGSTALAGDSDASRFAGDSDASRFIGDSDASRFAGDSDASRFVPLSFSNVATQLLDVASTELIARAACAVFGYRLFSSMLNVEQTPKALVIESVDKSDSSERILTCKLARCSSLLDIGL